MLAAALPGAGTAQVAVSGTTTVSVVEHRVDAGFGVERSSGAVAGAGVGLGLGRFDLDLAARGGTLGERDLGEVSATAGARVVPWLVLRGGVLRRAYSTDLGRQRWTMLSLAAETRLAVAGPAASGMVRLAWLPVVDVNGLAQPSPALAASAGVEYRHGPLSGALLYEVERYDFLSQAAVGRREQLSALTLRLSLRSGRGRGSSSIGPAPQP